jgi:hypothetical protein
MPAHFSLSSGAPRSSFFSVLKAGRHHGLPDKVLGLKTWAIRRTFKVQGFTATLMAGTFPDSRRTGHCNIAHISGRGAIHNYMAIRVKRLLYPPPCHRWGKVRPQAWMKVLTAPSGNIHKKA